MTVRIIIEADTVSEALEQARELGGGEPGPPVGACRPQLVTIIADNQESVEKTANVDAPPPMINAVPKGPIAPAPTVTPEPERDARGIPWDARVHAGNKATTQDGNWKKRRGVDPIELIRVEEELKAQIIPAIAALPTADAPPPPPPETDAPPVTFASLFAEAKGLGYTVEQLDAMAIQVTNGEVTKVALLADKAAYVQAIHDLLVPNG